MNLRIIADITVAKMNMIDASGSGNIYKLKAPIQNIP